jgi:hypothetical protein
VPGLAQYLAHARRPGGAHAAGTDRDDGRPRPPGCLRGPIPARVSHDDQVHRCVAQRGLRPAQAGQAGWQQVLLVVRRHDDADGLDHAIPPAWAADLRSPSARVKTSAAKSGSR